MEVEYTERVEVEKNSTIRGFKLMGEFSQGEHYVKFKQGIEFQRGVERKAIAEMRSKSIKPSCKREFE